jgi:hypothetical protein
VSDRPRPYRQLGERVRYSQLGTKCPCDGQYHSMEVDAVMIEGRERVPNWINNFQAE